MNAWNFASIIPRPIQAIATEGAFVWTPATSVTAHQGAGSTAALLIELCSPALGFAPIRRATSPTNGDTASNIQLKLDAAAGMPEEAYRLEVTADEVSLTASDERGLIMGIQTLRQLLPLEIFSPTPVEGVEWAIPCGVIEDSPRFRWRGVMLDCARHFMPLEFIYKWIDLLSLHKMNVFHWHLTDDQGWRIEIKKYPRLTEIGAWREDTLIGHALPFRDASEYRYDGVPHGGFYTQEQIRDVVAYAQRRNVTIVPEIEMPGHSQAAIAAYPELGNVAEPLKVWNHWGVSPNLLNIEESTIRFIKDVLLEVMELFPSSFIHIGGDEAPKDQWLASERAQSRMKELGLQDGHAVQSWFIRQIDAFLASHGRRLIGWDEILEGGLAPGAAVMSWRGEEGGRAAARAGHDVVMAPQKRTYFDHYQTQKTEDEPLAIGGFNSLENVYRFDPVPADFKPEVASHVLGSQGHVWSEYIATPADVERMAFPRVCALAEVLWSPRSGASYNDFTRRLKTHARRLKAMDVNAHRSLDAIVSGKVQ